MNTPFALFVFCGLGLVLAGCGGDSKPPAQAQTTNASTSGGDLLTAPVDYLAAAGKAQQNAVKTVDTTTLNKAIEMFHVEQGRYPKDLNELVDKKFMPKIPAAPYGMKIEYDATAGTVKVVKQ
jgi:hypothetical protein